MNRCFRVIQRAALLGITVLTATNAAQAQTPTYKEGDRVEFSENGACLGTQYAIPSKGTIIKVNVRPGQNPMYGSYEVEVDPLPGKAPRIVSRPISSQDCGFRTLAGAAPKIQTDKLLLDENNSVLANRELLDCENLKHSGRNGSPPPVELAKKLIRCLYEHPSPVGQDGATTMDITSFTIGAPHRWRTYIDIGQGTLNTLVYPVHVRWNMKTFYRWRNVQVTDKEATFTCFADATNLWVCGLASGPSKEGKTQEIKVTK